MFKKFFTSFTVKVILIVGFSLSVLGQNIEKPAPMEQAVVKEEKIDDLTPEQIELKLIFLLKEKAKRFGIDTNGLTDEQLKEKVIAKENEEIMARAKNAGIEVDGLTNEQLKEKVIAKENEEMIAKAKKAGVETDGLTPDQVIAKVNERDKEVLLKTDQEKRIILEHAKILQIDTIGLSFEQIKKKVIEEMLPILEIKAKELGVDSTGLSYEQLFLEIRSKAIEIGVSSENR